eukprot:1021396-Rhodomonas_salina.1
MGDASLSSRRHAGPLRAREAPSARAPRRPHTPTLPSTPSCSLHTPPSSIPTSAHDDRETHFVFGLGGFTVVLRHRAAEKPLDGCMSAEIHAVTQYCNSLAPYDAVEVESCVCQRAATSLISSVVDAQLSMRKPRE